MTDREVLDLVLDKVTGLDGKVTSLESKVTNLENDVATIKEDVREIKGQIVELRDADRMILSEVERVHEILDIHKEDKTVHIA
ncbi:MAG: hypothetical protein E7263_05550 [Lachnospiraceae bacterium]|nr:hypothetical protein [Lachnospiraceae bacterium]